MKFFANIKDERNYDNCTFESLHKRITDEEIKKAIRKLGVTSLIDTATF